MEKLTTTASTLTERFANKLPQHILLSTKDAFSSVLLFLHFMLFSFAPFGFFFGAHSKFQISSLLTLILVLCLSNQAHAFDLFPEFQTLTEDERSALDDTVAIDSEYQGDVTSYIFPLSWESHFFRTQNPFQIAFGSLSNKIFLQHSRLSLERTLNGSIDFRFNYLIQRDLDVDQTHAYLELVKWLDKRFGLSAYGEPSHFKRENDFGLALLFRPNGRGLRDPLGGHEIRAFHTWVDFTRNKHNSLPDYFSEGHDPKAIGLVGRCFGCLGLSRENGDSTALTTEIDYLQYFVRWEQPTTWILPQTNSEYSYQNFAAGISTRLAPQDAQGLFINSQFQVSKKFEGNSPTGTPSPVVRASLDRRLIEALLSVELPGREILGKEVVIEPGLGWFERDWRGDEDKHLNHKNLEGFVKARFDGYRRKEGFDRIEIFYDATMFWGEGDPPLISPELKNETTEHRVGLRYSIPFNDESELILMGAADADEHGTFEGGQGMFRTSF